MRLLLRLAPVLVLLFLLAARPAFGQSAAPTARDERHATDDWKAVAAHLPDPATASAQKLEMEADILRARRFPEDAIDYYNHALARGGTPGPLLNKIGLAELELHNTTLAHAYFVRAVKLARKNSDVWNNLGASDYLNGDPRGAISAYKKAIKLNRHEAVFHANLSTIYFERKDFGSARKEIAAALKLDPTIFDRAEGSGGIAVHVLSAEDQARLSFEMARMYARAHLDDAMLHSLAKAAECGMDVEHEMRRDPLLTKYAEDPRVLVIVQNAEAIRVSSGRAPAAPPPPALASAAAPGH